jgi:hypothetical protein
MLDYEFSLTTLEENYDAVMHVLYRNRNSFQVKSVLSEREAEEDSIT